jgi:hypothetical protein
MHIMYVRTQKDTDKSLQFDTSNIREMLYFSAFDLATRNFQLLCLYMFFPTYSVRYMFNTMVHNTEHKNFWKTKKKSLSGSFHLWNVEI